MKFMLSAGGCGVGKAYLIGNKRAFKEPRSEPLEVLPSLQTAFLITAINKQSEDCLAQKQVCLPISRYQGLSALVNEYEPSFYLSCVTGTTTRYPSFLL